LLDGGLQFPDIAMYAATNLLFCQRSEPAFDQVNPGCACGGEVEMKAWPFGKPTMDQSGLMCAVVVQNQMHV
jgi:hypothetical protein